jgi:hypothetical protein
MTMMEAREKSNEEEARYSQSKTVMTATKKRNQMEISFFSRLFSFVTYGSWGFVKREEAPAGRWVTRIE